ncbi:hypothetical protein DER44DRAFT_735762 [Fusarium oxysporum]|nr:hypothetical protein DER44DRAFT_735762 [Fusarium oxysporum]
MCPDREDIRRPVNDGVRTRISSAPGAVQDAISGDSRSADDTAVLKCYEAFLLHTIGVSIYGGSITFTVIVQQIRDPAELHGDTVAFHQKTVLKFLSAAWLLFGIALGLASVISLLVPFLRPPNQALKWIKTSDLVILLHLFSFPLCSLLLGAFTFLSLCVVAYVGAMGWITCAVTSAIAVISLCCWVVEGRNLWKKY